MDELTTPYNAEDFDTLRRVRGDGTEYWTGRDLNRVTGYASWQKFEVAVKRAIAAIANMQMDVTSHVNQISRLVERPQGGSIQQGDFELSRYAAHLVMINGDPRKPEIAKAQTYFAVKTREAGVEAFRGRLQASSCSNHVRAEHPYSFDTSARPTHPSARAASQPFHRHDGCPSFRAPSQ